MTASTTRLACGCEVTTARDFIGRMLGTIVTKGEVCAKDEHSTGQVVIMPGRDNARPE